MKFRPLITIAALCFVIAGCKSKIAMDYNDMIVKKQKALGASMNEAEPKLKTYFTSFEYDSIASISARMEVQIDSIIQEIKRQPAPKVSQGENFKKAALNYFDFMKSIYTSYKNYGLQTTPEGRMIEKMVIPQVISQENKVIADMQEAQKIFAKNNGFKIRPAK